MVIYMRIPLFIFILYGLCTIVPIQLNVFPGLKERILISDKMEMLISAIKDHLSKGCNP